MEEGVEEGPGGGRGGHPRQRQCPAASGAGAVMPRGGTGSGQRHLHLTCGPCQGARRGRPRTPTEGTRARADGAAPLPRGLLPPRPGGPLYLAGRLRS